jgi:hypothetical protein
MRSTDLTPDFPGWTKWGARILQDVPHRAGVYVFRLAEGRSNQRLKAESDIIYIGCATNCQDRLRSHLNVRTIERNTAYYLRRVEQEIGPLEISCRTFETQDKARNLERSLLAKFAEDHIEFPPLNRQESGKKIRMVEELLEVLTPGQRQNLPQILETLQKMKSREEPAR